MVYVAADFGKLRRHWSGNIVAGNKISTKIESSWIAIFQLYYYCLRRLFWAAFWKSKINFHNTWKSARYTAPVKCPPSHAMDQLDHIIVTHNARRRFDDQRLAKIKIKSCYLQEFDSEISLPHLLRPPPPDNIIFNAYKISRISDDKGSCLCSRLCYALATIEIVRLDVSTSEGPWLSTSCWRLWRSSMWPVADGCFHAHRNIPPDKGGRGSGASTAFRTSVVK